MAIIFIIGILLVSGLIGIYKWISSPDTEEYDPDENYQNCIHK